MVIGWVFALDRDGPEQRRGPAQIRRDPARARGRSLVTQPRARCGSSSTASVRRRHRRRVALPARFVVQAVLGGAIALTALGARVVYGSALRWVDRLACAASSPGWSGPPAPAGTDPPTVLVGRARARRGGDRARGGSRRRMAGRCRLAAGPRRRAGFRGGSMAVGAVHLTVGESSSSVCSKRHRSTWWSCSGGRSGRYSRSRARDLSPGDRGRARHRGYRPGFGRDRAAGDSVRPGWWAAMSAGLVLAVAVVVRPALPRSGLRRCGRELPGSTASCSRRLSEES